MSRMLPQRLYDVLTLYDCIQDPATVAWMAQVNVALPGTTPSGRYPTPAEIRRVMDAIPGLRATYTVSDSVWQVTVTSRKDVSWAILAVSDYQGDPEQPHHFTFLSGWDEIIVLMASHLAKLCGPLVLLPDSGAPPQVVM